MNGLMLAPMISGEAMLSRLLGIMSKFVVIGGAVMVVFGAIKLAGAMGDHDGQGIRQGIFQMAGGAVVSVAGVYLATVV
ncbi:MAG: hypothetical protein L0K47_10615 [Acidipropionibacterium jensenii]|uniref:hypothetical protein n=1 Tax=Acidipropionibacterium jensenii TaxID=1749 RepID=UPI0026474A31|nr:hypothetical protein [Acidipropionibacterium jensenii]MDN5962356.1 hypothetical protein [Propionibacterium sp.]MDN6481245.1 hypothetical protein [Acidipropionibacterium jensenii]MDN6513741.1 hypothetical protein [Acidipropionibacterium jensenii]MDN6593020.1 hypothetical protein [Acidipropionibacterium jensenii]MDN6660222.1 hypothetical protein [Acidipropionibacterium jensenii]